MVIYKGSRTKGRTTVAVSNDGGLTWEPLNWRLDIANHSPTGLEWGYGGSGPAQLSIAILAHHFKVPYPMKKGWDSIIWPEEELSEADKLCRRVYRLHQQFKWGTVSRWQATWRITDQEVEEELAELGQTHEH